MVAKCPIVKKDFVKQRFQDTLITAGAVIMEYKPTEKHTPFVTSVGQYFVEK